MAETHGPAGTRRELDQATVWHERDFVARLFSRLYERVGGRVVYVWLAVGVVLVFVSLAITGVTGLRYLRDLAAPDILLADAIAVGVGLPLTRILGGKVREPLRLVRSWHGEGRVTERAPAVWNATIDIQQLALMWALQVAVIGGPIAAVLYKLVSGFPVATVLDMFLGAWVGYLSVVAAGAFAGELALRPMLEDIARFLPDDFSPTARSWRLRARALAPLPIVTLFSALIAGAYVDLVARGPDRYLVALGIGLVIVALASVIFWVVTRSLLEPVDELLAATRRVSQGDITTPVPVVTADELGALAAGFNQMLANLRQHERELRESRARIVTAADHARQRVERDLHDGAQQSLVLLNLKLAMTQRLILNDPNQAERNLDEARHNLERALAELRDLAHGIYPAMLENEGLQSALHEAAERSAIPTTIECNGANRYPPEIESAVYFCCLEALQNAAKHAGPGARATLRLTENAGSLQFEVTDNGHGFDPTAAITSSGIHNMSDRIGALGGNLTVHSAPGRGTAIAGTIPFDGS